jgi:hypothetical protein
MAMFRSSQSRLHAVYLPSPDGFSLEERIATLVSKEHLAGTLSMGLKEYTTLKVVRAAYDEQDWIRLSCGSIGMVAMAATLLSKRSGAYPDGDTLAKRIRKAALHPDTYSMHASVVYNSAPTLVAQINHICRGLQHPREEFPRVMTGVIGLTMQALLWKSMFGNQHAIGVNGDTAPEHKKKHKHIVSYALSDPAGLTSRLLPLALRATQLLEGQVKIKHNRASGIQIKSSAVLDILNELVMIGYTYQQMWKAEKNPGGKEKQWVQQIMDKATEKQYTPAIVNR